MAAERRALQERWLEVHSDGALDHSIGRVRRTSTIPAFPVHDRYGAALTGRPGTDSHDEQGAGRALATARRQADGSGDHPGDQETPDGPDRQPSITLDAPAHWTSREGGSIHGNWRRGLGGKSDGAIASGKGSQRVLCNLAERSESVNYKISKFRIFLSRDSTRCRYLRFSAVACRLGRFVGTGCRLMITDPEEAREAAAPSVRGTTASPRRPPMSASTGLRAGPSTCDATGQGRSPNVPRSFEA